MSNQMTRSIFLVIVIFLSACEEEEKGETFTPDINYIGYGTSFGECLGYCAHQMKLDQDSARLSLLGWGMQGLLPEIQCSRAIEIDEYSSIRDALVSSGFFDLAETIGCPDCADGGAEWVEISNDTVTHRVTFEYWNEPRELATVVPQLRDMMESIQGCEEK